MVSLADAVVERRKSMFSAAQALEIMGRPMCIYGDGFGRGFLFVSPGLKVAIDGAIWGNHSGLVLECWD